MATTEANVRVGPRRDGGAPRSVHERVRRLFDVVDRLGADRPDAALAALREILVLEPCLWRARELYEQMRRAQSPSSPRTRDKAAPSRADSPGSADGWIDEAEFFIAQDLWGDAYESLREAALATPTDSRVSDWIAFVEAEQRNPTAPRNGGV